MLDPVIVWYQYWFMLPISIIVASLAMILGVGGALFFSPIFILLFPALGVDTLDPADAFGAALITEVFGFSSGLYRYSKQKLIDFKTARSFIMIGIPAAIVGTLLKRNINANLIILMFAVGLWLIGIYSVYMNRKSHIIGPQDHKGPTRKLTDFENNEYEYILCNQRSGRILAGFGGIFTGLISVGAGETTMSTLRSNCKLPMKIASGTSVFVVTILVLTSSFTDIIYVGVESIPWTLVIFTIPGVLIGGQIGPLLASKVKSATSEKLLIFIFFGIGLIMILKVII